ncbi:hypothetical protein, partial [Streptomyces sp. NPDC127038]|uniref:hypothetical protein n=1 Tax=Streptomyces sp. NPDC127038 TaxID=3347114 RepID=UPI0036615A7A
RMFTPCNRLAWGAAATRRGGPELVPARRAEPSADGNGHRRVLLVLFTLDRVVLDRDLLRHENSLPSSGSDRYEMETLMGGFFSSSSPSTGSFSIVIFFAMPYPSLPAEILEIC